MRLQAVLKLLPLGLPLLALRLAAGQALPQPPPSDWSNFNSSPPPQPAPAAVPPAAPPPVEPPPAQPAPMALPPQPTPAPVQPAPQPVPVAPQQPAVVTPPPAAAPAAPPAAAPAPEAPAAEPAVSKETSVLAPAAAPATASLSIGDKDSVRLTSSSTGPTGLYHLESADVGTANVLRLALYGQYFRDSDFPVLQADDERSVGILTLGYAPLKWLDLYGGTQISSNVSSGSHGTSPAFVGELGDFWLGVKVGALVSGGLSLGGDLRGYGYSGVGTSGVGAGAFQPTFLATYDALQVSSFPLRVHLNAGFFFGSLSNLDTTSNGVPVTLRAPEQFALGYSAFVTDFRWGLGFEVPLPILTPFIEYEMNAPITGSSVLIGPDQNPVTYTQALPNDLDFGIRVTALRDISFLAGVDVAFQQRVALGVPILPPWEAFLGVSYNFDPGQRGEIKTVQTTQTVEKPVAAPEEKGQVAGTVVDIATGKPLPGALVTINGSDLPPVASNSPEGKFMSYRLLEGAVTLTVAKDGYELATAQATITKGQLAIVAVSLKPESKPVALKIKVHSVKGKPLAATVSIEGPKGFKTDVEVSASGEAEATLPNGGGYALRADAKGFLGKASYLDAAPNQPAQADFELTPEPKKTALIISADKIRLKKQIHFETDKAEILADSFAILDQVVDAVIKHHVDRLRVEGHTDNVGPKEHNLALSQERADAVMKYLQKAGIPAEKLESVGFGDQKPVAPNMTNRGRALNRRVEFDIL